MYKTYIKKMLDFMLSFLAIILLSWLILLLCIVIKVTSQGPVFFLQKRIGICKKEFYIIKFRTMYIHTPQNVPTHLLQNPEQYITPVGKFLRWSSLDELPQLFNILKGDMAIVGPRPALWNQYDLIKERDKYDANNVRPGLTGWAQVNGRDEIPISTKSKLDGEYIEKMGIRFDLKCLFKTVTCVIKHDGIREGAVEADSLKVIQKADMEQVS
jgi:Sugar transferases involved in lipopolysaccharide synthesis